MKKKLVLLLFTALLGLSACQKAAPLESDYTTSTTCANITMGNGQFAYHNDFIYFPANSGIGEYDLITNTFVSIPIKESISAWPSLFVDDDYIYYTHSRFSNLVGVTKDGKHSETIYENISGTENLYLTSTHAYYMNGIGGPLYRLNLTTGTEEELQTKVQAYHIDNNKLYVITQQNDTLYLLQSPLDSIHFEKIELSFEPIAVIAHNDTLYLSKRGLWELIMYKDGVETALPMSSFYYQVLDNHLFYIERASDALKSYHLETGTEQTIFENAYSFCILKEQYIAISSLNAEYIYDLNTETLNLMYPQEEE